MSGRKRKAFVPPQWMEPTSDNEWEPSALPTFLPEKRLRYMKQNTYNPSDNKHEYKTSKNVHVENMADCSIPMVTNLPAIDKHSAENVLPVHKHSAENVLPVEMDTVDVHSAEDVITVDVHSAENVLDIEMHNEEDVGMFNTDNEPSVEMHDVDIPSSVENDSYGMFREPLVDFTDEDFDGDQNDAVPSNNFLLNPNEEPLVDMSSEDNETPPLDTLDRSPEGSDENTLRGREDEDEDDQSDDDSSMHEVRMYFYFLQKKWSHFMPQSYKTYINFSFF